MTDREMVKLARARMLVVLRDGSEVRLIGWPWSNRVGSRCKVIQDGRHVRIPTADVIQFAGSLGAGGIKK